MSVAMYPGQIPLTWTFSLLHSLLRALVSCPSAPLAAAYAGTVNPPYTAVVVQRTMSRHQRSNGKQEAIVSTDENM